MSDRRALLTEREREIVAGDADVSDAYRYQTISRVRSRLDRLAGDLEALEAHGDLADELRDRVCSDATADSQRPPDSRESVETPSQPAADQHVDGDPSADMTSSDDSDDDLAGADYPAGKEREKCNAAVYAARAYLTENGAATKRQIVAEVMPEHPIGYDADGALEKIDAGDRYRGAWWRKVVKEGLEAFDDVAKPSGGASEWKYTGDK